MSLPAKTGATRRLLIGLDPTSPRQDLLETAFELAQSLQADVVVRFIGDQELRAAASFRTARTISPTGVIRTFNREDMDRALARSSRRLDILLRGLAGRYGVRLETENVLIESLEQWQSFSATVDLAALIGPERPRLAASLLMQSLQGAAQWTTCRIAVIRSRPQKGRPLLVEFAGSPAVLEIAAQLSALYGADVVLAVTGDKAAQEAALSALPESQRSRTRVIEVEGADALRTAIHDFAPALVVLDRQGAFSHNAQMQGLVDQLRCPVFLIG